MQTKGFYLESCNLYSCLGKALLLVTVTGSYLKDFRLNNKKKKLLKDFKP